MSDKFIVLFGDSSAAPRLESDKKGIDVNDFLDFAKKQSQKTKKETDIYPYINAGLEAAGIRTLYRITDGSPGKKPADYMGMYNGASVLMEAKVIRNAPREVGPVFNRYEPHQITHAHQWVKEGGIALFLEYHDHAMTKDCIMWLLPQDDIPEDEQAFVKAAKPFPLSVVKKVVTNIHWPLMYARDRWLGNLKVG